MTTIARHLRARIQRHVSRVCMFRECVVPLGPAPVRCFPSYADTHGHSLGCRSEQQGALILGYTKETWNNLSGNEVQPASVSKSWFDLNDNERGALSIMGYTKDSWDGRQPDSITKVFCIRVGRVVFSRGDFLTLPFLSLTPLFPIAPSTGTS